MKKVLSIVMVIALVATCMVALFACGAPEDTLQVYTNAGFAPFEYVNSAGKVVGVDIDIMNYIGKELGYKVIINDIEFKDILNQVQGSKLAVGAAGMSKNDERDKVATASIVYATSVQYVIAPNGTFDADAVVTLDAILAAADKIGVQAGTTGQYLIEDYIEEVEGKNTTVEYTNAIVASTDIGSTLQAVVIDELPAKSIAGANSNLSCWKIDAEPESYVLYFNKDAGDLVKKVNAVLEKMIKDGTINQYIINHSNGN
ncbi:MAG: transporter substrate-binding domain-containing protein [Clostridia bacterium]|nr:transporter substrate-binding domain-containing protein [Clostridia bacterium]